MYFTAHTWNYTEISLVPTMIRIPDHPGHSVVDIPTTLPPDRSRQTAYVAVNITIYVASCHLVRATEMTLHH